MAACSDITEIGLELDKELDTVLEKNYRIKENIREISKKRTWKYFELHHKERKIKKVVT